MDYQVELVARALYDADDRPLSWDGAPEISREEFRQYARNALALLGGEIGILLLELEPEGYLWAA